ncbi:unnamed protein product [Cylindrotheca closterium]|uniref:Aldehyde dehydrogenase domain-containing protein n=1 Tax=Cylindrotheca closterium TaxID=2856 RepID=A0AAD2PW44_9STRA|nr:unnamed protein product [Cylindrotheca closterium]
MGQGVAVDGGFIINTNPATGEVVSKVKCSTAEEIDKVIKAANEAQETWALKSPSERIAFLKKGLKEVDRQADKLVEWMILEMGKPIAEAKEELEGTVDKDEFLDILEKALEPQVYGSSTIIRDPFGVVAVLSPWNFPVDEILLLALPALASGNTVIIKPSEVVPETGACLVKALQTALPPNVIQVVQGDGVVGAHIVGSPDIHMVAMTGSSATGRKIIEMAAPQMKRVVLEMGGKDPMIVFDDADMDKAAHDAVKYSLSNTGQVCCSIERIYVAESIYDEFQTLTTKYAAEYKVGNGMDPANTVGPMVSQGQRNIVREQVKDAVAKGAKLLHQSEVPEHVEGSSFHPVTVLADATESMDVFTKETFGPVVAMAKFDGSEAEAIRLANKTEYGLGSSIYTKDLEKARRVARRIGAGQVGINCYAIEAMDIACPWVGHKHSGYGFHSGVDGFHQFSIPKSIVMVDPSA